LSNPNSASLLLKYDGAVMSSNMNRGAKWHEYLCMLIILNSVRSAADLLNILYTENW